MGSDIPPPPKPGSELFFLAILFFGFSVYSAFTDSGSGDAGFLFWIATGLAVWGAWKRLIYIANNS